MEWFSLVTKAVEIGASLLRSTGLTMRSEILSAYFSSPLSGKHSSELLDAHLLFKIRVRHAPLLWDWKIVIELRGETYICAPVPIPESYAVARKSFDVDSLKTVPVERCEWPLESIEQKIERASIKEGWIRFIVSGLDADTIRDYAAFRIKAKTILGLRSVVSHEQGTLWSCDMPRLLDTGVLKDAYDIQFMIGLKPPGNK